MTVVEPDELIFVTGNGHKFQEARNIAEAVGVKLVHRAAPSQEIQTDDLEDLVARKAREAFEQLLRPLFVEHTSLHIAYINDFPGGYTSAFLQSFRPERICELFGQPGRDAATGRTTIGYCDGLRIRTYQGSISGRIVPAPRGPTAGWGSFGWNRVFAPDDPGDKTFAEMGEAAKNVISMRRGALEQLFDYRKHAVR